MNLEKEIVGCFPLTGPKKCNKNSILIDQIEHERRIKTWNPFVKRNQHEQCKFDFIRCMLFDKVNVHEPNS